MLQGHGAFEPHCFYMQDTKQGGNQSKSKEALIMQSLPDLHSILPSNAQKKVLISYNKNQGIIPCHATPVLSQRR